MLDDVTVLLLGPVEIHVSPQHRPFRDKRTWKPAASRTFTAAWPTSGVKCSVNVSTHSSTGWPV
ncbi:hypothetical protein ACFQ1S_44755, partial [Kibdelosporangium lantanae]